MNKNPNTIDNILSETKEKQPETPPIVEDISTHYRLEGDDFWYTRVIGGTDIPLITFGPGPNPDPQRYCK